MKKEIREKIIEIIENYTKAIIGNSERFIPEDFINKTQDLLKEKQADQILELVEQEKQRGWNEGFVKGKNLEINRCKQEKQKAKEEALASKIKKIEGLKKDPFFTSGQIKMPKGHNPDNLLDVVFCANNTISDTFNQAIDQVLSILKQKR